MLCLTDISQKIMYDTAKAESELLSLINSTFSHEMRNPLNSIINQCKIMFAYCEVMNNGIETWKKKLPEAVYLMLKECADEFMKSIDI